MGGADAARAASLTMPNNLSKVPRTFNTYVVVSDCTILYLNLNLNLPDY